MLGISLCHNSVLWTTFNSANQFVPIDAAVLDMRRLSILSAAAVVISVSIGSAATASLIGVLPETPGGSDWQAYYDDQLDITWTADASMNGFRTWLNQSSFASSSRFGHDDWGLPNMDVNGDGVVVNCQAVSQAECADNQLGHLFWYGSGTTLGGGVTFFDPGPFTDVRNEYWSSTLSPGVPPNAYHVNFVSGNNTGSFITGGDSFYAWPVHPGNLGASVPEPGTAALVLFGLGILGTGQRRSIR